MVIFTVRMHGE